MLKNCISKLNNSASYSGENINNLKKIYRFYCEHKEQCDSFYFKHKLELTIDMIAIMSYTDSALIYLK